MLHGFFALHPMSSTWCSERPMLSGMEVSSLSKTKAKPKSDTPRRAASEFLEKMGWVQSIATGDGKK